MMMRDQTHTGNTVRGYAGLEFRQMHIESSVLVFGFEPACACGPGGRNDGAKEGGAGGGSASQNRRGYISIW